MQSCVVRRSLVLSVAFVSAMVAACSDGSPEERGRFAGRYYLTRANGAPLPYILTASIDGSTDRMISGSFEVVTRGRAVEVHVYQTFNNQSQPTAPARHDTTIGPYRESGDTMFLTRAFGAPPAVDTLIHFDGGFEMRSQRVASDLPRRVVLDYLVAP